MITNKHAKTMLWFAEPPKGFSSPIVGRLDAAVDTFTKKFGQAPKVLFLRSVDIPEDVPVKIDGVELAVYSFDSMPANHAVLAATKEDFLGTLDSR